MQFSFGVFLLPMADALGVDRGDMAGPFAVFVLVYSWLSVGAGRATDHFGPRWVIGLGALSIGCGYALLGTATELWQTYWYLGCIAGFGASVAFVPCNATVIRWFVRQRGLALAIASSGISIAGVCGPPVAAWLIQGFGWRDAITWMGLGAGLAMLVAAQFMVRDPSVIRTGPDGDAIRQSPDQPSRAESGATLAQACASAPLWLLIAGLFSSWLVVFLPYVHLPAYGLDLGLTATEAAMLLTLLGVGGLIGRFVAGAVTDRLGRKPGVLLAIVLQALVYLALPFSDSFVELAVCASLFGGGYSAVAVLFPALIGDLYGRAHVGAITGLAFGIGGGAAAAGPYVAGMLYDSSGSYDVAFFAGVVLNGLALVFFASLPTVSKETSQTGVTGRQWRR